jgi:hypothetical protein
MFLVTLALATQLSNAPVDPTAIAQTEFSALEHGTVDRSHYSARMTAALSAGVLSALSAKLSPLGDLKRLGFNAVRHVQNEDVYSYVLVCANGTVLMKFALDPDRLIDGVNFQPWGGSAPSGAPGIAIWGGSYDLNSMSMPPEQPGSSSR